MLQEYIGELMIMLYEERKAQILTDLSREVRWSKQDAYKQFHAVQKLTMLELLNLFWSEFLKVILLN